MPPRGGNWSRGGSGRLSGDMTCSYCGADLELHSPACQSCGAPTPAGQRQREEEQQRAARAAEQQAEAVRLARASGISKLDDLSLKAFGASMLGVLCCFAPIFQIVSVVLYFRARALSRDLALALPLKAKVAFVIDIITFVGGIVFVVWAVISDNRAQDRAASRIGALEAQTSAAAQLPSLDFPTACALSELYALRNGHSGEKGYNLGDFQCVGKVAVVDERASLGAFSFKNDTGDRFQVTSCFIRGTKWYVKELTTAAACPDMLVPARPH